MRIRNAIIMFAAMASLTGFGALAGTTVGGPVDPNLPNLVPMFPDPGRVPNNFIVTNRLGAPTLEWEILTSNIGGSDWFRPPRDRSATCFSSVQYFRMPQTHEYTIYWIDPATGNWIEVDRRRKNTICIQDDFSRGRDPQNYCLADGHTNIRFPCQCNSAVYGPGRGNGVSRGWSDSYFRNLQGQWALIGDRTGDFVLSTELDPDRLLQADDLGPVLDADGNVLGDERDATHDDNISYVFFTWDGTGEACPVGTCVTNVSVLYTFNPVCPLAD